MTPEQLFARLLAERSAQPFVTYYDEASGERSELSAKSTANWVAKTHHLLIDELGLGVGDRAAILLPAHWISVPILLGCLTAGLSLTDGADVSFAGSAEVAFVDPARAPIAVAAGIPDVFTINPTAAASGYLVTEPPPGTTDYVSAVRPQADTWASVHLSGGDDDSCIDARTRANVVADATERAAALGLDLAARALSTRDWNRSQDWLDTILAPLAVGGSVVFVRNAPDEAVVARRMQQERATVRL